MKTHSVRWIPQAKSLPTRPSRVNSILFSWWRNSLRSRPLPEPGTTKNSIQGDDFMANFSQGWNFSPVERTKVLFWWQIWSRAELLLPRKQPRWLVLPSHLGLKFHFDYTDLWGFAWAEILAGFLSLARIFSPDWSLLLEIAPFISRWFLSEPGLKFTFESYLVYPEAEFRCAVSKLGKKVPQVLCFVFVQNLWHCCCRCIADLTELPNNN